MPSAGRVRYLEAPPSRSERPRSTLVLLHAFPLNARMWEPQLALADHGWRVLAPHYRGMDGGIQDPPAVSIDDYAGDVIDLLDSLHIEDAVIGGLSLGGYVAFGLFRHAPRYFRGIVLADTRSQADPPEAAQGRARLLSAVREKGPSAAADEMVPRLLGETTRARRPDVVERVRTLILSNPATAIAGAITAIMTRPDSTPLLSSIHCPTLIVVGEQDTLTPPAMSQEMQRGIPGSELVVIPDAGHLSSLEQPSSFNAALARFLEHRI
jgi:3-oxoadipate enol-lactonase